MREKLLIIMMLAFGIFKANAQQPGGQINGRIITQDGTGASNISVVLKGAGVGTLSEKDGTFILKKVKPGTYTIVATAIGLQKQERKIVVTTGNALEVNFTLKENSSELNEIIISSSKTNKFTKKKSDYAAKMSLNNLENPQVYTSITKELLTDQMVFSVDDATKNVPGLQKMWEATGRGGDGGAYYSSRGFILQSQLRNGIAGNVTGRIDAANLESLEVLKGPSATLFGSALTSYGGLINRVTKKPYDHFGGEVAYSSGSYGFNRISADVNTPLDSAKKVLFRLNTAYNYQGSFQDNGYGKDLVIAPSISYKVNDKLSFLLDAELYSGSSVGKQIIFFYFPVSSLGADRADQLGLDYKRSYHSNDLVQTSRNDNFFGQMNYKFSDKWTSQTNYTSTYSFSNGRSPYFFLVPNAMVPNAAGVVDPTAKGSDYLARADQSTANSQITVSEIQQNFNGEFNIGKIRNRVVLGLDYLRQNSNQVFYSINKFDIVKKNGTIPTYADFNETNLSQFYQTNPKLTSHYINRFISSTYSVYVSDVVNLSDNLIALAALRMDGFDNKGNYQDTTGLYTGAYKQLAFAPKFGLVYQPIKDQISIFANYQSGFTNKTGQDYLGHGFKPEQANQFEGGVKLNLFGGKLSSTISYYDIKVKNVVRGYIPEAVPGQPAPPINQFIQNGTKLSKGIEAEVIANPIEGFNVIAGFAYNDNKLTNADPNVEGRRDAYSMSPYSANLWMSYKLNYGKLKGAGIGFGGNYASDNKIVNSVSNGVFILPHYVTLNASAFYDQPKYRVGLKVDNLTNKQYWIGYGTMNPQQLRSVIGSIAFKF
ncbi:iron complex outermembrane receptor protein [Pedobacter cryoconitis]|uniref:TonB-dependent receptor n=1 Tax=Pedobacter cryoconitis TaxID=188932 RepID=UPI001622A0D7|nr:TonB-dependent receptor [Pedobacter cryoconitis]MBB6269881.1 iron complex outermembrane receptor protein [Pedobacter cryoconitis]